jgi:hypothetical protein
MDRVKLSGSAQRDRLRTNLKAAVRLRRPAHADLRGTPAGPALAVVAARLSGCTFIYVSIGGNSRQSVGLGDGGLTLAARAFKIVGLDWKLPA